MNASTIAQQLEAEQAAAPQKYRELINPSRQSQPDDIDTLKLLMLQLGITPNQVSADIAALKRADELSHPEADRLAALKRVGEARGEIEAYDAETQAIIKQREQDRLPLSSKLNAARIALDQITKDNLEVRRLRHSYRFAFGLPPRPETPTVNGPVQTIQERGVAPAPSYEPGREPFNTVRSGVNTHATHGPDGQHRFAGHIPTSAQVADADVGAGSIEKPASDADVAASLGLV